MLRSEGSDHDAGKRHAITEGWQLLAAAISELDTATRALRERETPEAVLNEAVSPLNDEQLVAFRQMLCTQDLDALSFFSAHRAALNRRLGNDATQRIADLLDALGFDEAAELVAQVVDQ